MLLFVVCFDRNEFYSADLLVAPTQDLRKRDDAPEESGMDEEEEEERENDEQEAAESGRQQRKSLPRGVAAKYENPSVFLRFKLDAIFLLVLHCIYYVYRSVDIYFLNMDLVNHI